MDFITSTVKEAGIDKHNAFFSRADALFQVNGGAALFIHDTHFQGITWQIQSIFNATKQFIGERHFFRAVHFWFYDVNRAGARITSGGITFEVVDSNHGSDITIHNAFRNFIAVFVDNGWVSHQVTNVTHEQQAAAMQRQFRTIWRGINAIRVHSASKGFAAFSDRFGQVAFHQAQPVAVHQGFVSRIDRSHGIFAVHNSGQGCFHNNVIHASRVGFADSACAVDLNFKMQTIIDQQYG